MPSRTRQNGSVLDTNRNIASISSSQMDGFVPADKQYKSFLLSLYRIMNLNTADMVESLVFATDMRKYKKMNRHEKVSSRAKVLGVSESDILSDDENKMKSLKSTIKLHPDGYLMKTTMDLRGCSRLCSMAKDDDGREFVANTGYKCRNKYCFVCNRARSQKFTGRFVKLITDKFCDFNKYRFYFLTLTLVHNDKVRTGDYLAELKGYVNKLTRSKLWRSNIRPPSGHKEIGTVRSYENKVGRNGNHIHVHMLLMCDKIGRVTGLEKKIREWWRDKTLVSKYQSNQIRLDLIGKGLASGDWSGFLGSVREVMKYSTKFNDTNAVTSREVKILGDWMKSSKGKNFKNATGLFSGYGLTSHKSKLDDKDDEDVADKKLSLYIAQASGLKYHSSKVGSVSLVNKYDAKTRVELKDSVTIVGGDVVELTDVYDDMELKELLNQKSLVKAAALAQEISKVKADNDDWLEGYTTAWHKKLRDKQGVRLDDDGFNVPIET